MKLTIGMANYNDHSGVYFTLQALRLYQDLVDTELLVVDNYGNDNLEKWITTWCKTNTRYVRYIDIQGTSAPRQKVFEEARGEWVICIDSHVLLTSGAISKFKEWTISNTECNDLLHGPMMYDNTTAMVTHMEPVWRGSMWGIWSEIIEEKDLPTEVFEIPMHGLGLFACRKSAWLGFNPNFSGFGGEEGYIHQKFRKSGYKVLCLPFLRWLHRFNDIEGAKFNLDMRDRIRNYLYGFNELGMSFDPIRKEFGGEIVDSLLATIELPKASKDPAELYSYIYSHAIPNKGLYGGSPRREGIIMEFIRKYCDTSMSIIDLSCGRGHLLRWLLASGYKACGTEIADSLMQPGGELYGLPVRKVYYKDLVLDYPPANFDLIVSNDVIEHLADEECVECAIRDMAYLSKKYVVISTGGMRAARNPFPELGLNNLHTVVKPKEWWINIISKYLDVFQSFEAAGSLFIFGKIKQ
jgi:2-polyprenyl-3-methyl-5-hydroxy-6-metoxy-1,4-benzoquinol methylase